MDGTRPLALAPLVCCALLLCLAVALPWQVPASPRGEEATFLMMVESLWHDQDLRCDPVDLARAYRYWNDGPTGLRLGDGGAEGWFYALPVVPALVALPFYGVFGPAGIPVLGVALLVLMVWLGGATARRRGPGGAQASLVGVALVASALAAYALRLEPTVITAAGVFVPLGLWLWLRRSTPEDATPTEPGFRWRRPAVALVAGVLLGAVFTIEPLLLLLAVPPVVDLLLGRQRRLYRLVPLLLVGLLVTVGVVGALQRKGTGEWRPAAPERSAARTFHGSFPGEATYQPSPPPPRQVGEGSWHAGAAWLPTNAGLLLVGRYGGVLPYFPFALLAVFLFLRQGRRGGRAGWLLLGAVVAVLLLLLLREPHGYLGGTGAFGNRNFAILYPALLLLLLLPVVPGPTTGKPAGPWPFPRFATFLALGAAGLWTVPAVVSAWGAPGEDGQRHGRLAAFQLLPLEVPIAIHGGLEDFWVRAGGDALWLLPRHAFYAEEENPHGVWMRGATEAEVLLVTTTPRDTLTFPVQSVSADNVFTAQAGGGTVKVRFDSSEKQRSTPITLLLGDGQATGSGGTPGEGRVYRLRLASSDGLVPMRRDGRSGDPRYLGTFLAFGDAP